MLLRKQFSDSVKGFDTQKSYILFLESMVKTFQVNKQKAKNLLNSCDISPFDDSERILDEDTYKELQQLLTMKKE